MLSRTGEPTFNASHSRILVRAARNAGVGSARVPNDIQIWLRWERTGDQEIVGELARKLPRITLCISTIGFQKDITMREEHWNQFLYFLLWQCFLLFRSIFAQLSKQVLMVAYGSCRVCERNISRSYLFRVASVGCLFSFS